MSLTASELPRFLRLHTKVVISPWCEMLSSLHVLDRPEHHSYRNGWARRILAEWPKKRLEALNRLGLLSHQWLALHELQTSDGPLTVADGLARLRVFPDGEWCWHMLNRKYTLSDVLRLMEPSRPLPEDTPGAEEALLRQTAGVRQELEDFLSWYAEKYFAQEWTIVEPWMVQEAGLFMERLRKNPVEAFSTLHPRLTVTPQAVEAQKATVYRYAYEDIRQIMVVPSTFVYPHLLVGFCEGLLNLPLHVQADAAEKDTSVPGDLLRMLKAAADSNRLHILRLLRNRPYCTKQLAAQLSISEAAVSKHLGLLTEARLVQSERKGAYVFYRIHPEQADMMVVYLRQFLEQ